MILRRFSLCILAILLTAALAACDSSATPTAGTNNAPGGSTSPVTQASTPAPQSTLVVFQTTGGTAGTQKLLEIGQGKGKYKSGATSKTQDVPAGTYNSLLQQVKAADFFNLKDSYDNGKVSNDVYYNITVQDATHNKTVKVAQAGGKDLAPKPLQDLITQLNNIQSGFEK